MNKFEISPEHKKFTQGIVSAFIMILASFTTLKYEELIPNKNIGYYLPIFISFLLCLGLGHLIYSKRHTTWPHFLAGFSIFFFIAFMVTFLIYFFIN